MSALDWGRVNTMDDLKYSECLQMLDTTIFSVESQTSANDQKSLLLIQNMVRKLVPNYVYLEVGSHLGGTLVPHLVDPLCRHVLSVDKRPASQRDERGTVFEYEENSTQRMLDTIKSNVPESALMKLTTFDYDVSDLDNTQIDRQVDLSFIDAEHTVAAVFRDFVGTMRFLADSFVIAFHDANLLCDGLQNIECFLRYQGIKFRSFFLPDVVFAIFAGDFVDLDGHPIERLSIDRENFIRNSRTALWKEIAYYSGRNGEDAQTALAPMPQAPEESVASEAERLRAELARTISERDALAAEVARWSDAALALGPKLRAEPPPGHRWRWRGRERLKGVYRRLASKARADRARDAGKWELAVRFYRDAVDLDFGDAESWAQLGHALQQAGKPSEAEFAYHRSRELGARWAVHPRLANMPGE